MILHEFHERHYDKLQNVCDSETHGRQIPIADGKNPRMVLRKYAVYSLALVQLNVRLCILQTPIQPNQCQNSYQM